MAASLKTPPVKKSTTAFPSCSRRGKVKAQIFEGIAESVSTAVSRAGDFLGLIKKDDVQNDCSAPEPPPKTTKI